VNDFLRATFQDGTEGRFKVDFIVAIHPSRQGTVIVMLGAEGGGFLVKESPEDLYAQMEPRPVYAEWNMGH
jgi:hypothetical protein